MPQQQREKKESIYHIISQSFTHSPVNWIIYSLSIIFVSLFPLLGAHLANIQYTFWLGLLTVFLILCATTVRGLSCFRIIYVGTFSLLSSALMFLLGIFAIRDGGLSTFMAIGTIAGLLCLWIMPLFRYVRIFSNALENANRNVRLLFFRGEAL